MVYAFAQVHDIADPIPPQQEGGALYWLAPLLILIVLLIAAAIFFSRRRTNRPASPATVVRSSAARLDAAATGEGDISSVEVSLRLREALGAILSGGAHLTPAELSSRQASGIPHDSWARLVSCLDHAEHLRFSNAGDVHSEETRKVAAEGATILHEIASRMEAQNREDSR